MLMNQHDRLRTTRISRNLRTMFVFLTALFGVCMIILVFHIIQDTHSNPLIYYLVIALAGFIVSIFFSLHFHFKFRSRQ